MLPQEVIRAKRDGATLAPADIAGFVRGLMAGDVTDAQAAALAMAIFFRGMTADETAELTRAMCTSGETLAWDLPGPVLDKHSTGGVGDCVSVMLAPALAACGAFVPMISGRGLGHTGGTLDKLDSIPGYRSQPDIALFRKVVAAAGTAIIGQTAELAPADGRLYAIRDVTGTVESVPLITASILSKKLAAGLDGLVMDVKFGQGAFMTTAARARELARSLVDVAARAGLTVTALLTDMNQPLASCAGNAVEMRYAIDYLTGAQREPRLHEVVVALGGEALATGCLVKSPEAGRERIEQAIASGQAAERFARMVRDLGGPADLLESPARHLPQAPVEMPVFAEEAGIVTGMDVRALGLCVVELGGGRRRPQDRIDPRVGLSHLAAPGDDVGPDRPLGIVHAADQATAEAAARRLRAACRCGTRYPSASPVVAERIG